MLPPINHNKSNLGRITKPSKVKTTRDVQKSSSSDLPSNDSKPLKGKIRQLVFSTLKRKFGNHMESEPEFIKMVDTICNQLEPSITDSTQLQEMLNRLIENKK
ncbi:hypothetical protein [Pseudoalteromonas sp. MMG022]|uniref:hypothetical protein n=1 Tax=Pseudoalteromonas sp. MMG022 TaxID=2909978 RepID=UPI001F272E01|nr:hypothetical protein [Pseudoalteromonas sp. MMG022]MCF6436974.1 hypothetical protein [Pseudoalteromonas sp. MMG022]